MKLLILLVGVLGIIAIAQLTKVYELTRGLRKTREEEISPADNKLQANLLLVWMFIFFGSVIYLYSKYGNYLPEPASEHGVDVDKLMSINIWIITIVFFVVNALLLIFSYKYYYRKDRKARFFAHDNRLEMVWTLIPGVTMAFIIVYGLITWNKITGPASENAIQVEVYSKQFGWIVRYPGENQTFGSSTYNLIDPSTNPLGLVTKENIKARIESIDAEVEALKHDIEENEKLPLWPDSYVESQHEKLYRLGRLKQRILDIKETQNPKTGLSEWMAGNDDRVVNTELHIPVGKEVEFIFRSQDVIHSAYMPHFRAQMNTVPGIPTRFKMTPTITTEEMRGKLGDDEFNYILLCNKVCGVSHYNMKINVIVESEKDYQAWVEKQKKFIPDAEEAAPATENTEAATASANNIQEVVAEKQ